MLVVCMSSEMQVHLLQVVQVARFWDGSLNVAVQKEYARVVVVLTRRSLVRVGRHGGTINIRVPIIILACENRGAK